MVPVRMAGMEKLWLKSLRVMSNVKVFATRDRRPDERTNTTQYIDPYIIHLD